MRHCSRTARRFWPRPRLATLGRINLILLLLGTGIQATPVVDFNSNWGLVDWIPGMFQVVSYGQSSLADRDSFRLLQKTAERKDTHYLRLNAQLPHQSLNQFDASPAHMQVLLSHAADLIETHRETLDKVILRLLCAKAL